MSKNPQVILKGRYQVVPRSIILLVSEGKVLLQKGSNDKKVYPGLYNGIGGHIERGEDVISGARRELKEETGLVCSDLVLAGNILIDVTEDEGILLFVFIGSQVTGELTESKEGSLHWIEIESIPNLPVVEDVQELVANASKSRASGQQFFGSYLYNDAGNRITIWQWS